MPDHDLACLDGLTAKRRAFVLAYVGEAMGNATEAARIAGYARPNPEGCQLLSNPRVSSAIETLTAPRENAALLTMAESLEILAAIARGEIGDAVTNLAGEPTGEVTPAKPADRINAIKTAARMCGWEMKKRANPHQGLSKGEIVARLKTTIRKLEAIEVEGSES